MKYMDIVPAKTKWARQYAKLEHARIVWANLWSPTTYIDVDCIGEDERYADLVDIALESVCECFRPYVSTASAPIEELESVIDDPYYFHHEAGEDWHDCPQWAQDREESLADDFRYRYD